MDCCPSIITSIITNERSPDKPTPSNQNPCLVRVVSSDTAHVQPIDLSDRSVSLHGTDDQFNHSRMSSPASHSFSASLEGSGLGGCGELSVGSDRDGAMNNSASSPSYSSIDDGDNRNDVDDDGASSRHRDSNCGSGSGGLSSRQNQVGTVMLRDVSIVSLMIDGKERLCLAQISNTLLKAFSYNEIHNRRVALGITCVQCTPVQLEILRRFGAMPISSRRCGMITKREAERLVTSFLEDHAPPKLPEAFAFSVVHECGWGCKGSFIPSRYNSSRAKCIKCSYCAAFLSPNKFIFHFHRTPDAKYHHPDAANFNSWRRHLVLDYCESNDALVHAWEDVKAMFNGGSRKRMSSSPSSAKGDGGGAGGGHRVNGGERSDMSATGEHHARKRQRLLDHGGNGRPTSPFGSIRKQSSSSSALSCCLPSYHHRGLSSPPMHSAAQHQQQSSAISPTHPFMPQSTATFSPFSVLQTGGLRSQPLIDGSSGGGQYYDAMKVHMMDLWKTKSSLALAPPPPPPGPPTAPLQAMLSPLSMLWGKGFQFPSMHPAAAAAAASVICRNAAAAAAAAAIDFKQQQQQKSSDGFDSMMSVSRYFKGLDRPDPIAKFVVERDRSVCNRMSYYEHVEAMGTNSGTNTNVLQAARWAPFSSSAFRSVRNFDDVITKVDSQSPPQGDKRFQNHITSSTNKTSDYQSSRRTNKLDFTNLSSRCFQLSKTPHFCRNQGAEDENEDERGEEEDEDEAEDDDDSKLPREIKTAEIYRPKQNDGKDLDKNGNRYTTNVAAEKYDAKDVKEDVTASCFSTKKDYRVNTTTEGMSALPWDWPLYRPTSHSTIIGTSEKNQHSITK